MKKSSVSPMQRFMYFRILCYVLERIIRTQHQILFGKKNWVGSRVRHNTELCTPLMVSRCNSSGFSQDSPLCSSATNSTSSCRFITDSKDGPHLPWWKRSTFRCNGRQLTLDKIVGSRVWRHTQGSSGRPASDLGWGSSSKTAPGSLSTGSPAGRTPPHGDGSMYSQANVRAGKVLRPPYPSVAVLDRGHWKGVAGSGWDSWDERRWLLTSGGKVIAPGCISKAGRVSQGGARRSWAILLVLTDHKENGTESLNRWWSDSESASRGTLKSKGGGKLSIHFCADGDTIETVFRTIVSVTQLSIYGNSLRCVWGIQCLSNKNGETRVGRTIRPILRASKIIDHDTQTFDWNSCTWKSSAEVQRTSGKAPTTKSCE